jgi:CheY-like chemotaxis protein
MSNSWDLPLKKLGDQIEELQESQEANLQEVQQCWQGLEEARQRLLELSRATAPGSIADLPGVLQTLMIGESTGIIILAADGQILLFNNEAVRIFGHSLAGATIQGLQSGFKLFLEDKVTPFDRGFLPCSKATGSEENCPTRFFVKSPDLPEGMWISMTCTTLKGAGAAESGIVVLLVDLTEHLKIKEQLQDICKQLNAEIAAIESACSELRTLSARLHARAAEASSGAGTELQPAAADSGETIKKALVVDDIPINQKLLIMRLKKLGFEVESALNGKVAVSLAEQNDFSIIFMDCDMPVMNGYEATLSIRKRELKTGKHVPIVAMTSYDRVGDRERCLAIGMDEYLTKGTSSEQLQEVVEWCLSRGERTRETRFVYDAGEGEGQLLGLTDLRKTFEGGEHVEVLRLFLNSATTLTNCLRIAIEEKDADSSRYFAISLKGPCLLLGLTQMAYTAENIAASARDGQWDQARGSYNFLRKLYDSVRIQIEKECRNYMPALA